MHGMFKKLKSTSHTPQEHREHYRLIQEFLTLRDPPQNPVSPTDDTSSPPDEGSNIQTCGTDAASQPDGFWRFEVDEPNKSWHHELSGGHSTGFEIMSTGTGNLFQRGQQHVDRMNTDVILRKLESIIHASPWLRDNEPEPLIGDHNCPTTAHSYGTRGVSVYTAFIEKKDGDTYGCKYGACRAYSTRSMEEAVRHLRYHHFNHSPYLCIPASGNTWYVSVFPHIRALVGN